MQVNNISSVSFAGRASKTKTAPNATAVKALADKVEVSADTAAKTTLRQKLGKGVAAVKTTVDKATEKVTNAAKRTGKFIQNHTPKKLVGFFEGVGNKATAAAKSICSLAKKPFVVGVAATAAVITAGVVAATKLFHKGEEAELGVETI